MLETQENIFSTPIWGYMLNSEQFHSVDYIKYIHKLREEEPSSRKSNFGGWQSRDNLQEDGIFREFSSVLLKIAKTILEDYTKQPMKSVHIQSMWANVNEQSHFNMPHTHEGALSGVFYLLTPENSGNIVFINPAVRSEMSVIKASNYAVSPKPLACLFFPSWLQHYVEPNLSDQPRLSLSFNVGV